MINLKQIQKEVEEFWETNSINSKIFEQKGENYFLLDGPPYANGIPHVGHIKNTVMKDLIIRLNLMKGKKVLFQPGFDTHGLPIENMVEKQLKLQSKKDIEKYGISKFMEECKKNAALNKDIWMNVYKKIGSLYYLKEPYLTYNNSYIEGAWWAFSEMYKKGIVYEGEKPVMWCPHCETSLAGYEVTDSYKDVQDPGIYVTFKLANSDDFLLVYTTTPWTLPANVAIAVAPKEDYVKVELGNGKKIIIGKPLVNKLSEIGLGYKIIEEFKGETLVGKKYEPLLDIPLQNELASGKLGKAHEIIASIPLLKERVASKVGTKKKLDEKKDLFEEFVTMDAGTGMVHTAPGHGKTDYEVGQHYQLAVVSPVNDQGELIKDLTTFSGFVKKADKDIIEKLKNEDKLFHYETITHSYPLCWRCKSPLIFRLSKQLFFRINKIKKIMQKENKKVNWYPEFARERFDNWITQAEDWNISRQRYWGIPIPIWKSDDGDILIIENREQLEKLSGKEIKDLHAVENLIIQKDKKDFKKVKGILDVWFDSGVAPWASMGYPVENKELFEKHFPVDRVNEAQDQIRGWFYSLMFCSTGVFEKAPYKAVSMVGWVLDSKGQKMSKSLGNVITGEEAVDELGGDILRYYSCWDIAPYDVQKFNIDIAKKEVGKLFNVLWNLQNLVKNGELNKKDFAIEDKWIISKINSVMESYQNHLDNFETHLAIRNLHNFILNDLSRNYIRMTRNKPNQGRIVLYCLEKVLRLLAPIAPFITEKIWQELRKQKLVNEESVHLTNWPKIDKKEINENLEIMFEQTFQIIEIGLRERDKAHIGLRWPLANIKVYLKEKGNLKDFEEIIKEQLNVKSITFESLNSKENNLIIELDANLTPELEAEGYARELSRQVQAFRKKLGLNKDDVIKLAIDTGDKLGEMFKLNESFIKERTNAKELFLNKSNVIPDKERFKNKIDFRIKDKRGTINILTTN